MLLNGSPQSLKIKLNYLLLVFTQVKYVRNCRDYFCQFKVPFIPKHGKDETWYCCAQIVHESSHMGHVKIHAIQFIRVKRRL